MIDATHLPIVLPEVENIYQQDGLPPLGMLRFGLGIQLKMNGQYV
jgi:hypothetical protein